MDKRILSYIETLIYYDSPHLIVTCDQVGQYYICLLKEVNEKTDIFYCVPISRRRLELVNMGEIGLREAFGNPEVNILYEAVVANGDLTKIPAHEIDIALLPTGWLPESDTYLEKQEQSSENIVKESLSRSRAIISCKLIPPESRYESKITVEHLLEGIGLYQRVVKNAYQKSIQSAKGMSDNLREILSSPDNYKLEVFGFSGGSFTVNMQTALVADWTGYSTIARALEIIDAISSNIDNTQVAFDIVAKYGGHFATAYKDLLKFIIEREIPFNYEWSMPQINKGISGAIIPRQAKPLYKELLKKVEIEIEQKVIIGKFSLLGKNGMWKLISDEDNNEYTGTSDLDLAGTVFRSKQYSIVCEEKTLFNRSTGKEIKKLHLISFEPT